ncbi:MAG: HipA domain-containing protein, partial [Actinobacteria bacterium]|nr:HipA domain-containing protein [Actinomycetota bacterium]
MSETLDVYCFGEPAGRLTHVGAGDLHFEYAESWLDAGRPSLSRSLPTVGDGNPAAVENFFDGLLPEGGIRELIARELHVSPGNTIGLLEQLGWDCAGAISVYPHGARPVADGDGSDVSWLSDAEIAKLVDELPRRPLLADGDGEVRISLAGVQDKLPVIVGDDGRIGLAHGDRERNRRTPSTHILKSPIERLPDSVANEAFCLKLADALGLKVANAEPRRVAGRKFLLVRRFDRRRRPDGVVDRLHQEDFCQALGVAVNQKYEAEGGPGLAQLFDTLRRSSAVPA